MGPENPLEELISTGNLRTVKDSSQLRYYGKSFVVPEDIAIQWVHKPTHCFGGECREFKPRIKKVFVNRREFRLYYLSVFANISVESRCQNMPIFGQRRTGR